MGLIKFYRNAELCWVGNTDSLPDDASIIATMQEVGANAVCDDHDWYYSLETTEEGTPYLNNYHQGRPKEDKAEDKAPEGKTFVYRAVEKDKLELYKTNPDEIPDLSGAHFIKLNAEKRNGVYSERQYDENEKYLHFFLTKEDAVSYGEAISLSLSADISVIKCVFDKELVESTTEKANYEITSNSHFTKPEIEEREECAIPLSQYSPEENFVKVVEELKYNQVVSETHGSSFLDSAFK